MSSGIERVRGGKRERKERATPVARRVFTSPTGLLHVGGGLPIWSAGVLRDNARGGVHAASVHVMGCLTSLCL